MSNKTYFTFQSNEYWFDWRWQGWETLSFIKNNNWCEKILESLIEKYWYSNWTTVFNEFIDAFATVTVSKWRKFPIWTLKLIKKHPPKEKVEYFRFVYDQKNSYYFLWNFWNIVRFSWNPIFIIEELKKKKWPELWKEIFIKFLSWLSHTNELLNKRVRSDGIFYIIYKNTDVYKGWQTYKEVYSWEKKSENNGKKIKEKNLG